LNEILFELDYGKLEKSDLHYFKNYNLLYIEGRKYFIILYNNHFKLILLL